MKTLCTLLFLLLCLNCLAQEQTHPIVAESLVFEEKNGIVAVEAEHFYRQSNTEVRKWYRYQKDVWPRVGRDADDPHCVDASGNAYLEILPDTRIGHSDKLIVGENISDGPGTMAVLHYKVHFNTPGRYYVWVRAYSTGPEDNGIHVGFDGNWPETGENMQWCDGKKSWRWDSKQRREENHCGIRYFIYLDIERKGLHDITFSMREDGFEFDKFLLAKDRDYEPDGKGPESAVKKGELPEAFPTVKVDLSIKRTLMNAVNHDVLGVRMMKATDFSTFGSGFYQNGHWLAINPNKDKEAVALQTVKRTWTRHDKYDIVFVGIGENDGQSEYAIDINDKHLGSFKAPLSKQTFEESSKCCKIWENVKVKPGDIMRVRAKVGTDGKEYSRGRWAGIIIVPPGQAQNVLKAIDENTAAPGDMPKAEPTKNKYPVISGELRKWHKVSLTFNGPETSETEEFNPFLHYRFDVTFWHRESGMKFKVPGYFAADGNAGESSAQKGNKWRVHFTPDKVGEWTFQVNFRKGNFAAISDRPTTGSSGGYMDGAMGTFVIGETDKSGRDFRGKGRLNYVGERYLKFAETGEYFLKVGADSPENMLSYADFDGSYHNDGHNDNMIKTWSAHEKHWNEGDPTWKNGKGKAIIGAVNYLASKGMNAFSFITNNIEGDDKNVFPYIDYDTYDRIDCSKMDQWEVLFSHADSLGMFLHFKLMEHENQGLMDNSGVGVNSKLYYRELIARFGHHLALNWNMCEESGDWMKNKTAPQSKWQRLAMAGYFEETDPYHHHRVVHNGIKFDDILGPFSPYTGASVQTTNSSFVQVHGAVLQWINKSNEAGKQWAVACDEPGDASHALLTDKTDPDHNNARINGLWGTFMAGGCGTEWYFGYKDEHSDLTCEDWSSRDKFWEQGNHLLDFFEHVEFHKTKNHDHLVNKGDYCLAEEGKQYVVFLRNGMGRLNLEGVEGNYSVEWFDPKNGGGFQSGKIKEVQGGSTVQLNSPENKQESDWAVLIKRTN